MSKLSKVLKQSLNPFKADQIGPLGKHSVTKNWVKLRPYVGMVAGAVAGAFTGGAGWAAMTSGALTGATAGAAIDAKAEQMRQMDQAHRDEQAQQQITLLEEEKAKRQALKDRQDSLEQLKRQTQISGSKTYQGDASSTKSARGSVSSIILG